ncbi:hypothetical protein [Streptosporangium sp. CA-115845]|uniref:hypothetical protein n=1 Tax=Streptosporangium sp. CA-115845 TaxID=3240071 RepID=UPI003D8C12CB
MSSSISSDTNGQLRLQRSRLGRGVLGGQRRDHQITAVVQTHQAIPNSEDSLQLAERLTQLVGGRSQRAVGVGGLADQLAELRALVDPLVRCEQVGGRVGVTTRARHEHVPAAQPIAQRQQGAQLPVVPVGAGVARLRRGLEVAAPPRGHEPVRRIGWDPASAGGVELAQDLQRLQQPGRGGATGKPHRRKYLRGELPQIPIRPVQRGEVPVIARQPWSGLRHRRPQARPADPFTSDQVADLLVADLRVGDDDQQIIQQHLPVFSGFAPFGQRVAHLAFGLALPRGDRLVEQLHNLVEHVGRRLRQHRQQDRVPALRIAAFQRLRGQPPTDRGQEPAPLGRQRRQVQTVRAQRAQELQLGDLGLHRGRGRLHRAGGQPPQTGHADLRIGDQQPVQRGAPCLGELVRQPVERLPLRLGTGVGDPLDHGHQSRTDHACRDQVLTPEPEQQGRRVMFHRPGEQELV